MIKYPEETREEEIKRRMRSLRWVSYRCGCKLAGVTTFPYYCITHEKGIWMTGPMFPHGEPCLMDPRYVC